MSQSQSAIIAQYESLPRAGKWLIIFLGVLIAYFAIVEPVMNLTDRFNNEADKAAIAIDRYADTDSDDAGIIRTGQQRWGAVSPPGRDESAVLDAKVDITKVLEKYNLTRQVNITQRQSQKVRTDRANANVSYTRGPIEIKFTAKPHIATEVLAQIEALPSVAQVAQVRLRKLTDRPEVEATFVADAWYSEKDS